MKTVTITVDFKSLCIGALGVLSIVALSNFNRADQPRTDAADEVRRYQAVVNERGIVIIDTKTGKFMIGNDYSNNPRWRKGDFATDHAKKD